LNLQRLNQTGILAQGELCLFFGCDDRGQFHCSLRRSNDDDSYASREEVRDVFYSTEAYLTYNYQKNSVGALENCGSDNICVPDLKLEVKTDENFVTGRDALVSIEVLVTNQGEDAFDASFIMNVPAGLQFKGTRRASEAGRTTYSCAAPTSRTNATLRCDIGNPLPAGESVNFKIVLEPTRGGRVNFSPVYDFHMEATAANEAIEDRLDNIAMKTVGSGAGPALVSDFLVTGSSFPSDMQYESAMFKEFSGKYTKNPAYKPFVEMLHESEIGPQVVQIFDIRNSGDSDIDELEVFINWPAETLEGDPLMYVMDQPETLGNIRCDFSPHVNFAKVRPDPMLQRKSFLSQNAAPLRREQQQEDATRSRLSGVNLASANELEKFIRGSPSINSNIRGYEVHETWNTTSVNGGPATTHYSSKNRTITRGRDGRIRVSETSTERVIPNEYSGSRIESSSSRFDDTSSSGRSYNSYDESSTRSDFESEQQERARQMEEFRLRLEAQAVEQQRRLEEERKRKEEHKENFYRPSYTSRTQAQTTQTITQTRSNEQIRILEEQRQQVERQRLEQERLRLADEKRIREEDHERRMEEDRRLEQERRRVEEERQRLEYERLREQERLRAERERLARENEERRRGATSQSRSQSNNEDREIETQRGKVEQQRREHEERLRVEQQQRGQEEMRRRQETHTSRAHTQSYTEKTESELEEESKLKYYDRWNSMSHPRPAPGNNLDQINGVKTGRQYTVAELEWQRNFEAEQRKLRQQEMRRHHLAAIQEEERIRFEQERREYGSNTAPRTINEEDSDEIEAQRIKEEQEQRARQALEESRRAHEEERKREEQRKREELERIRQSAMRLSQEQQKLLREQKEAEEKERKRLEDLRRIEEERERQRMELERLRAESVIRAQQEEEDRRRYESTLTLSQSQSQTQSQSWNQDQEIHRKTLEQRMQEEEHRLRIEQMQRAEEEQRKRKEEFIRTQGQVQSQGRRNSSRYTHGSKSNQINANEGQR
jgi:Integrin alpha